jgi:hypothetical protein
LVRLLPRTLNQAAADAADKLAKQLKIKSKTKFLQARSKH